MSIDDNNIVVDFAPLHLDSAASGTVSVGGFVVMVTRNKIVLVDGAGLPLLLSVVAIELETMVTPGECIIACGNFSAKSGVLSCEELAKVKGKYAPLQQVITGGFPPVVANASSTSKKFVALSGAVCAVVTEERKSTFSKETYLTHRVTVLPSGLASNDQNSSKIIFNVVVRYAQKDLPAPEVGMFLTFFPIQRGGYLNDHRMIVWGPLRGWEETHRVRVAAIAKGVSLPNLLSGEALHGSPHASQPTCTPEKKHPATRLLLVDDEEEGGRIAQEGADFKAKEETDRRAKEEADRKATEEADRLAKEEADRRAKEEADRKANANGDRDFWAGVDRSAEEAKDRKRTRESK